MVYGPVYMVFIWVYVSHLSYFWVPYHLCCRGCSNSTCCSISALFPGCSSCSYEIFQTLISNYFYVGKMVINWHKIPEKKLGATGLPSCWLSADSNGVMNFLLYIMWNGLNFVEECLAMCMENTVPSRNSKKKKKIKIYMWIQSFVIQFLCSTIPISPWMVMWMYTIVGTS